MEGKRSLWIDAGKGSAIIMVVLLHFSGWYIERSSAASSLIFSLSDNTRSLRMPLFFLISGLLVSSSLQGPSGKTVRRCVNMYALFVFWTSLLLLKDALKGEGWEIGKLLLPFGYWYFWALAVYTALALAFANMGQAGKSLGLTVAAAIYVAAEEIVGILHSASPEVAGGLYIRDALLNLVWFLVGAFFKKEILHLANTPNVWARVGAMGGSAVFIVMLWGAQRGDTLAFAGSSISWLILAVSLLPKVETYHAVRGVAVIGRHTLIIYVLHLYFMSAGTVLVSRGLPLPSGSIGGEVFIIIFTTVAITTSIFIEKCIKRIGLRFLVEGPLIAKRTPASATT